MKSQEFKSTNQKVTELLNSNFTVKSIFDLINFANKNEVELIYVNNDYLFLDK